MLISRSASVVSFADTLAGYGCISHLPANAQNFTTVELKANFLNTAADTSVITRPGLEPPPPRFLAIGEVPRARRECLISTLRTKGVPHA